MTLLSLIFVSTMSLAGGNVVGNAGDGFMVNGELHLRDLIEVRTDITPWVGPLIDPAMPVDGLNKALAPLAFPTDILQRKLNDMNLLAPGSGDAVISLIESYEWKMTDDDDTTDTEGSFTLPNLSESSRVQIAIRRFGLITVNRAAWALLPDTHKAALIIHEALFSAMRPLCMGPANCIQPQLTSRYRIGLLFHEAWMRSTPDEMAEFRKDFIENLESTFHLPIADLSTAIVVGQTTLPLDLRSDKVAPAVRAICTRTKGILPMISLITKPVKLNRSWYTHRKGAILDYRVFDAGPDQVDVLDVDPKKPCEESLFEALQKARERLLPREVTSAGSGKGLAKE